MEDNIVKDSKEKFLNAINKCVEVLAPTYGAAGTNVIIEEVARPYYRLTNDGKLILDSIHFSNRIEEIARKVLSNSTDLAEKESGDGRKTTCLLTAAILNEAQKAESSPMDVYRSLNDCVKIIYDSIDKHKRNITVDDVKSVATIASENETIGSLIQEIYQQIGKDGIIEIDTSNLPTTFYTITEGIRIRAGYFGKYSETETDKAIYKKPSILISKDKISSVDQLEDILRILMEKGKNELVLYVEDIDMSVASRLAMTHMQGGFKTLIIKAPVLWKDWVYEDLSKLTGATAIDSKEGKTFKNITFEDFGTCDKIICTKDETRLIGTKDISEHLKKLDEMSLTDDQQKVRISWLQTRIAILKVGGNSDTEIGYALKKARDACSASYWALRDGIVVGGGIALVNAVSDLPDTVGGNILKEALLVPARQICLNAGYDFDTDTLGGERGFDAKAEKVVNLWDSKIVDSVTTTKNAVKNAISIAGTNLTASSIIPLPKVEQSQNAYPMPLMR